MEKVLEMEDQVEYESGISGVVKWKDQGNRSDG